MGGATPGYPDETTLLTDVLPTVIINSPTLKSPERRSLQADGRVVPSEWREPQKAI